MLRSTFLTLLGATTIASLSLVGTSIAQESEPSDVAVMRVELNGQIRSVVFKFHEEAAPQTVQNFRNLVEANFYDGHAIHRAIPGYLVQTGDPLSKDEDKRDEWGTGGPGYTIPGEFTKLHSPGSVAMARLGDSVNPERDSNGSQFYFALDSLPHLDGTYTVFGQVLTGFDVLDAIAATRRDENDNPVTPVTVLSVRITTTDKVTRAADDDKPIKTAKKAGEEEAPEKVGPVTGFLKRFW